MTIAVLDLDIDALPPTLVGADGHASALVLLRVDGRPAGQALIPLAGLPPGEAGTGELRLRLLEHADSAFWEAWLRQRLAIPNLAAAEQALPLATVVVCTRDRTDDLERCIAALLAMPDDGQEILIVDNAPRTEATHDLVRRHPSLRYVREDRPGLDVARNRALTEAAGEVVAFTDDDAAVDPLWLRTLLRNFGDPLVLAAAGATMAMELETEAQIAFQRYGGFLRGFRRRVFDAADHDPMLGWHAGAGVNMALRRSAVTLVGPFDEALDAGTATSAGGDSDLFRRILAAGYRIAYEPEALVWHRHRRSMAELERQLGGYETASLAMLSKALVWERDASSLPHIAGWLAREVPGLARAALRRPGSAPLPLALVRVRGGLAGPLAYRRARRA